MATVAERAYDTFMDASRGAGHDPSDAHVVASILAIGMHEAEATGASLCDRVGLPADALRRLIADLFPGADAALDLPADHAVPVDAEEQSLRDILWMYATEASALQRTLAALIARRCICPHHLWQDLGLRNRTELSRLMGRHFAVLAQRNRNDMKWKKFLYRMVCRSEGFTLCTAPSCSECDDFDACFSAEDGESLLARIRLANAVAAPERLAGTYSIP